MSFHILLRYHLEEGVMHPGETLIRYRRGSIMTDTSNVIVHVTETDDDLVRLTRL